MFSDLANKRTEYDKDKIDFKKLEKNPLLFFNKWLEDAKDLLDFNAASLSTVDENQNPHCRIVLIKEVKNKILFFTNYNSQKAKDLEKNPKAALTFYWPSLQRQLRIEGKVHKSSREISKEYFASRPLNSKLAAEISRQSEEIEMDVDLESILDERLKGDLNSLLCPDDWGGFELEPNYFEFWQGRPARLHDRLVYELKGCSWILKRLSP